MNVGVGTGVPVRVGGMDVYVGEKDSDVTEGTVGDIDVGDISGVKVVGVGVGVGVDA